MGLWAQVPHYLGTMSYPAASVALLAGLHTAGGIQIEAAPLRGEAEIQRERIDQLVAGNAEHRSMIEQLETVYDQVTDQLVSGADPSAGGPSWPEAIPTADELGAEVERYLRDQSD